MIRQILEARVSLTQIHVNTTATQSIIKQIYLQLMGDRPRVEWKCVMFHNAVKPKARFTMWLQLQNRLMTMDRLDKWGMQVDLQCVLCSKHNETRDHLFLHCEYSLFVWHKIKHWLQLNMFINTNWEQHLRWVVASSKGKTQAAQIFRLAYAETIYALWIERNQRVFDKKTRPWSIVAKEIAYMCNVRAPVCIRQYVSQLMF
ncbi:uncharacterized protein LOC132637380 [Lycium barbarum]|uniref:uncharacterized protein LOC132637380 n=1 Tax=Lycium barbarum TaxID=112863 RepID=UPI00293EE79D|nr:uncharacterized protein LOC132637380 [Lycium barbarum]